MKNCCLIASSGSLFKGKTRKWSLRNNTLRWAYFDKDILRKDLAHQKLRGGAFNYINIAKMAEEVVPEVRREYIQWMDGLNRRYGDDLEWWLGSISSRNVHNSNIFQYFCYLAILKKLLEQDGTLPDLIFLESKGLAETIKKWAKDNGINVQVDYLSFWPNSLKRGFSIAKNYFSFLASSIFSWFAAFISRITLPKKSITKEKFVIIDTFIHDYSITSAGLFTDNYFPFLYEYLQGKGLKILIHPNLFGLSLFRFSIFRRMRKSTTPFIIREDFLSFLDYLIAFTYPPRVILRKINSPDFRGMDISGIVREETRGQFFSSAMQALLIYRAIGKLRKAGLDPQYVIDWYENQEVDRGLILGLRKSFPGKKIVGVQMYTHPDNLVHVFPIQSEVEFSLVPDIFLVTSPAQCDAAKVFTKDIRCISSAALRYNHLFEQENIFLPLERYPAKKMVLISLSFDIKESAQLLLMLAGIFSGVGAGLEFLVKCHPDYTRRDLVLALGAQSLDEKFCFFEGNLSDALAKSSAVVSFSSSVLVEAAAKGVPVIFVRKETSLNLEYLSGINSELITECLTAEELGAAIKKYAEASPSKIMEYRHSGNRIRDLFFTPVNDDTMAPFIVKNEMR